MAVQTTWCLAWVSAVLVLVAVKPSQTQRCFSEKRDDTTIDIPAAFSKGIKGTDPIYAPSWETCVETCCSERIAGDKTCNYAIFNTNTKGSSPNCYQFYFPAQEACPVKQAFGLVTYRIIKGKEISKPAASLTKAPHSTVNGTAPPQAAGFGLGSPVGGADPLPKASQHPKAGGTNGVEALGPSMVHESNSAATTIQRLPPVKLSHATLGSSTSRTVSAAAMPNPPSHTDASAPDARKTEAARLQPSRGPLSNPTLPSQTHPPSFSSLSPAPPTPPASLRGGHLNDGCLNLEDFNPDGSPATNDFLLWSDQTVLFAALFFGVLFFFLAVVLIAGKMLRSRQTQRYTRLDYLINDMYTHM